MELIRTTCPFDCWDACGALVQVERGCVTAIRGDPDHPYALGTICGKLAGYPRFLYSAERIRQPLLRDGSGWRPLTWPAALDLCVRHLEAAMSAGGDNLVFDLGHGNCGLLRLAGQRFFRLLGATITTGSLCDIAGEKGLVTTLGACVSHPPQDVLASRSIVFWGRNPAATNSHLWRFVLQARRQGAAVATVDVYRSATAQRSDLSLQIRPGTDVFLALAVARALYDLGLVEQAFLDRYARGHQRWRALISSRTGEEWSGACGVSYQQVIALARLMGQRPTSIWLGMGMQHYRWGAVAARFVAALAVSTGQLGVPGGGVSFFTSSLAPFAPGWADPSPLPGLRPSARVVRKPSFGPDVISRPTQLVWLQASNIAKQAPASGLVAHALNQARFKVAVELRLSETARLCDLVLPAASFLEFENIRGSFGTPWLGYMAAAIPPLGEARPEYEIYRELARRLGCEEAYWHPRAPQAWLEESLTPCEEFLSGGTSATLGSQRTPLQALRDAGGYDLLGHAGHPRVPFATERGIDRRFPTPDGLVHLPAEQEFASFLHSYRSWRDAQGAAGVKAESASYPLHLVTPKAVLRINSQGSAGSGLPVALVNPVHLPDGQPRPAWLRSPQGRLKAQLEPRPGVPPDLVVIEQGGHTPGAIGVNLLTPSTVSDDGEGACYYEAQVALEPLATETP